MTRTPVGPRFELATENGNCLNKTSLDAHYTRVVCLHASGLNYTYSDALSIPPSAPGCGRRHWPGAGVRAVYFIRPDKVRNALKEVRENWH